jgi:hypothetical protein
MATIRFSAGPHRAALTLTVTVLFATFVHGPVYAQPPHRPGPPPAAPNAVGNSALYGVDALASNDVWAVGYKYSGSLSYPHIIHWNGSQWSVIPNPASVLQSQMHGVAALASNDVWIVGQTWNVSDQAYILHWDGTRLTAVPCPNPGSYVALYGVTAVAANDVWAVGTSSTNGYTYVTLVEHWDGTAWQVVSSPGGDYDSLLDADAVSANDVWAVGSAETGSEILH